VTLALAAAVLVVGAVGLYVVAGALLFGLAYVGVAILVPSAVAALVLAVGLLVYRRRARR
jgi:hypothetical protein